MENETKRTRPQIHLSTAVALMISAGLLVGVNIYNARNYVNFAAGWPLIFLTDFNTATQDFTKKEFAFDAVVSLLILLLVGLIFEARHWGWSAGKVFVWAFLGTAIGLHMVSELWSLFRKMDAGFGAM